MKRDEWITTGSPSRDGQNNDGWENEELAPLPKSKLPEVLLKLKELGISEEEFERKISSHYKMQLYLTNRDFSWYMDTVYSEFLDSGKL